MAGGVLLDRSWTARLALHPDAMPKEVLARLSRFDMVAIESGGASALEHELSSRESLNGKLYRVRSGDMPSLSADDGARLSASIDRLIGTSPCSRPCCATASRPAAWPRTTATPWAMPCGC